MSEKSPTPKTEVPPGVGGGERWGSLVVLPDIYSSSRTPVLGCLIFSDNFVVSLLPGLNSLIPISFPKKKTYLINSNRFITSSICYLICCNLSHVSWKALLLCARIAFLLFFFFSMTRAVVSRACKCSRLSLNWEKGVYEIKRFAFSTKRAETSLGRWQSLVTS